MRVLLVVNANAGAPVSGSAEAKGPRKDYHELQSALAADVIDLCCLERRRLTRLIRRLAGDAWAQALLAWVSSRQYDAVFIDRESAGVAYALLAKATRLNPRIVMIGHLMLTRSKRLLLRTLRISARIDCLIVHSSLQQRIAVERLGVSDHKVRLVPYQVDEQFWSPRDASVKQQVCSAGLEYRDYPTLMSAVAGLDVSLVIAAASHWSRHRGLRDKQALPPNVRLVTLDYHQLRELYAESRFVVVPLHDVPNQAGITTILEAMAMGKAVIVSHSRGQTDVVRDRRRQSRSQPARATQPDWARRLGATREASEGQTGIYVRPGDASELRAAIGYLLANPQVAEQMGANGRRLIEQTMGLDHFAARVAALVRGEEMFETYSEPVAAVR